MRYKKCDYMLGDDAEGSWFEFHKEVKASFEQFWQNNKLAVDEKGRIYRTNVRRVRPKYHYEMDFRKKGKKEDGDNKGTNS